MKTSLVLLLLLAAGPVRAIDAWTTGDSIREASFVVLSIIDIGQTTTFARACDRVPTAPGLEPAHVGGCRNEVNPLIGPYPSQRRINLLMGLGVVAHAAVSVVLPRKWRHAWQYTTIGFEGANVIRNHVTGTVTLTYRW